MLLESEPGTPVTIRRVADAVGAAPMALYRYFPDRDALLEAAADRLLMTTDRISVPDGPWQDQLRAWMRGAQDRFRPYPQLLPYIAGRSPLWLSAVSRIADLVEPARLDEDDLALAVALINSAIISHATYEAYRSTARQSAENLEHEAFPDADSDSLTWRLIARMSSVHDRLQDTILEQTVATIERLGRSADDPG
jgi:AcrR family transcriptional regulator